MKFIKNHLGWVLFFVLICCCSVLAQIGVNPTDINLFNVNSSSFSLGQNTMSNSLPVVIASNQSTLPVSGSVGLNAGSNTIGFVGLNAGSNTIGTAYTNLPSSNCSISSATSCTLESNGAPTAFIAISGTWSGTITFESLGLGTGESTNEAWGYPIGSNGNYDEIPVYYTTTDGIWEIPLHGSNTVQAVMTTYTSGTANIYMYASNDLINPMLATDGHFIQTDSGKVPTSNTVFLSNAYSNASLNLLSLSCYNSSTTVSALYISLPSGGTPIFFIVPPNGSVVMSWAYPGLINPYDGEGWQWLTGTANTISCSVEGVYVFH